MILVCCSYVHVRRPRGGWGRGWRPRGVEVVCWWESSGSLLSRRWVCGCVEVGARMVVVVIVVMVVMVLVVAAVAVAVAVAVVAVSMVVMVVSMVDAVVTVLVWVEVVGVHQVGASALVVHDDGEGFWSTSVRFLPTPCSRPGGSANSVRFTREGCLREACCRGRLETRAKGWHSWGRA